MWAVMLAIIFRSQVRNKKKQTREPEKQRKSQNFFYFFQQTPLTSLHVIVWTFKTVCALKSVYTSKVSGTSTFHGRFELIKLTKQCTTTYYLLLYLCNAAFLRPALSEWKDCFSSALSLRLRAKLNIKYVHYDRVSNVFFLVTCISMPVYCNLICVYLCSNLQAYNSFLYGFSSSPSPPLTVDNKLWLFIFPTTRGAK